VPRKPPYQTALAAIERIPDLGELRRLKAAVEKRIEDLEKAPEEWQPPEAAVEVRRTARGCYALELVRCGKERCRCATDDRARHGPYWYLYRYVSPGKYSKKYIGRYLPGGADSPG
jgi:hypothetical protein